MWPNPKKKKKTGDLVISTGEILKDTLKAFGDFKNKQKSVWSNIFWYVKVRIQYTKIKRKY